MKRESRKKIALAFSLLVLSPQNKSDLARAIYGKKLNKTNLSRDILNKIDFIIKEKPIYILSPKKGWNWMEWRLIRFFKTEEIINKKFKNTIENKLKFIREYSSKSDGFSNFESKFFKNMRKYYEKLIEIFEEIENCREEYEEFKNAKFEEEIQKRPDWRYKDSKTWEKIFDKKYCGEILKKLRNLRNLEKKLVFLSDELVSILLLTDKDKKKLLREGYIKEKKYFVIDQERIFEIFRKNTSWLGLTNEEYDKIKNNQKFLEGLSFYLKEMFEKEFENSHLTPKEFVEWCFSKKNIEYMNYIYELVSLVSDILSKNEKWKKIKVKEGVKF